MKAGRLVAAMTLFMSSVACVFAQPQAPNVEWSRTYGRQGDDFCESVRQTSDGGYLLAGSTEREEDGWEDFWLLRTNAVGDCLWSRTYGGDGRRECLSMEQTADGGCVMAGYSDFTGAGGANIWIVKTDAEGDSQWSRSFGGAEYDVCRAVLQADDGGYILAGYTGSYGAGGYDFWLVKTDSLGDSLWSRTFGGYSDDVCTCAQQTADGGYILGGLTWSFGVGWTDIWLVKTDANGDSQWSRTIGGSGVESCHRVQQTADGGFVLAGQRYEPTDSSLGDACLPKTDAVGDCLWMRTFGGSLDDIALAVQQTTEGGYIVVTMITLNPGGDVDAEVIRTNAAGDSLWSMRLGGPRYDVFFDFQRTADGGFVFAGYAQSPEPVFSDMWLVKTGPELSATAPPLAQDLRFLTNYPNPFNARTTVEFVVPRRSRVMIRAFDLLGREVGTISDDFYALGRHTIPWECRNCASGTYWISMTGDGFQLVRKTILLR